MPKAGALVCFAAKNGKLLEAGAKLDKALKGAIKRAIESSSRFSGEKNQSLEIVAPAGVKNSRIVLLGLGDPKSLKDTDLENLGGSAVAALNAAGETAAAVLADGLPNGDHAAARVALGARLRHYYFDKYKTKEGKDKKPSLKTLSIHHSEQAKAKKAFTPLDQTAKGVFLARDVISEPANIIYPKSFVAAAKKLEKTGLKVRALGEREMKKLGMGSLLGVGQGSVQESQLLIMEWNGAPARAKDKTPIAIVGKGVCFDTGGISLKPGQGMWDMKWDMGGAGVTLGLMAALAARKAKVNVVGICGLVENMPDGNAQRPGDIVTSMSGQTIEVLNTDAEGRLVLADALTYVQKEFKPKAIVDLATLTGAIMVSLGLDRAGVFANDDKIAEQLTTAGDAVGEPLWRMPLGPEYDKLIDSDIADMKNIAASRWAGSTVAAQFLQRFIEGETPWAHLDIAGVTWSDKAQPTRPKGATAFGVRLLNDWIAENYES